MNPNRLMLGDWVSSPDKIGKIHTLSYNGANITVPGEIWGSCFDVTRYNDISPIPLTAEILEKNVWDSQYASDGAPMYHTFHSVNCVLEYYWFERRLTIQSYDRAEPWIRLYPMYVVNDLQHALRLCGLNDLADNFVI